MSNYMPIVFVMGIIVFALGIYIFTVDPDGPPGFKIGPLIVDNNNTLIQQRTGVNFNLSAEYTTGIVAIVMGSLFMGIPIAGYVGLPIYQKVSNRKPEAKE